MGTSFESGPDGVKFTHPKLGKIPVKVKNGLPLIHSDVFMSLLTELEQAVTQEKYGEAQVNTVSTKEETKEVPTEKGIQELEKQKWYH